MAGATSGSSSTAGQTTQDTVPGPGLVLDLDGTLIHTNMLSECALSFVKRHPLGILKILVWLMMGPARLKCELARHASFDASDLPLNSALESYAAAEKKNGRKIYLATAADRLVAQPIADRCGFFDGVLASDGKVNMKGHRKADALQQMFPSGFSYAGDSRADFPVWSRAKEVVVVGGNAWARRAAKRFDKPTIIFETPSKLWALVRCARPHQWAKNTLVFVPAVLSGAIADMNILLATVLSFLALCLVASSTYIVNDLQDLADDRRHWSKRNRPIASGALPISTAVAVFPFGLALGLVLAMTAGPTVALAVSAYLAITLAYSFLLKRVAMVDVATLAGLFTLRLIVGAVSAGVVASPWLLVFSMFLFSSLCFAKRYVELTRSAAAGQTMSSRGYLPEDASLIFALGVGTGISSVVIMVLYIMFDAFQQTFYGDTTWLWAFPMILFLWLSRIWLVAGRGKLDDDPVAYAVRDTPSLALGAALLASFIVAWSGVF